MTSNHRAAVGARGRQPGHARITISPNKRTELLKNSSVIMACPHEVYDAVQERVESDMRQRAIAARFTQLFLTRCVRHRVVAFRALPTARCTKYDDQVSPAHMHKNVRLAWPRRIGALPRRQLQAIPTQRPSGHSKAGRSRTNSGIRERHIPCCSTLLLNTAK
jgi:hypothetical protein